MNLLHQKAIHRTTVTSGSDIEKDSNGLTTTGVINGADNMTLDSGFYKTPKYNLGNYVWEDTNKDGKQDSTEKRYFRRNSYIEKMKTVKFYKQLKQIKMVNINLLD